jgi:hypothetical protein
MSRSFLIFCILLSVAGKTDAGWLITERTAFEGSDEYVESRILVQDNMIKFVENDRVLIFDLNRWLFTIVNPGTKSYWIGRPADYLTYVKRVALDYLEDEIAGADEYDRPFLESIYQDLERDIGQTGDVVTFLGELPMEIVLTDETDRLLGHSVNLFNVYLDRIMVEKIWLTGEINLNDDYDYEQFRRFVDEISWGGMFQDYRSSESYIHLMKSGLPLKTTETGEDGTTVITSVANVERISFPQSEFRPPGEFRAVRLSMLGLDLL